MKYSFLILRNLKFPMVDFKLDFGENSYFGTKIGKISI